MTKALTCPICRSPNLRIALETERFDFRSGGVSYPVNATFPVNTCADCGEQFVSEEGEIAKHEAVCRAMKRMTPREILQMRSRLSLTRKGFAQLTGFGEASLARWETGDLIQSESNDRLLVLLRIDDNVAELARLAGLDLTMPAPAVRKTALRAARATTEVRPAAIEVRAAVAPAISKIELDHLIERKQRFRVWYN